MESEFPTRPLGELVENHNRLRVPIKESLRKPGKYPYYGAQGIVDYVESFIFDGEYVLVAEDGENLRSQSTPVALLARGKFWVNNHAHIVRATSEANNRYLVAAINLSDIGSYVSGSAIPKLTKAALHAVPIPCPDKPEQDRIAAIIQSIDDRLDHNRALATKLEAIALRLFKSWFVDFAPVRAKAAGEKPPGLADDLAALFPDRFVDSELGEIPEGWGIASFSAFAELDTTSVKPFDHPEMQWTHFSIPSFDEGRFPATETSEQIASNKYQVRPGSVLVSKLNPTQWRCWRPPSELVSKHSICSTEFMQFVAPENQQEFLWGMCESDPFREAVLATVDGTTGSRQRAKPKDVMRSTIVLPHSRLTAEYSSIVRPLLRRVDACILEARSLSQLRDLILPRLISGKLRVGEAEEVIAEATG